MNAFNAYLLSAILLATGCNLLASVTEIENANQFNEIIARGKPVVVKVGATWCPACVRSANPFHKIAEDPAYSNVVFAELDTDKNEAISNKYNVQSLPTLLYFSNGKLVNTKTGFAEREVKEVLSSLQPSGAVEKKTEETMAPAATTSQELSGQMSEEVHAGCAAEPDTFFGRVYNSVRDFFTSIGNTISGWFK